MLVAPSHRSRPLGRRSRAGAVLAVVAALMVSVVVPASADAHATDDPAEAAAGWLAGQLVDGERLQTEFDGVAYDAPGPTADTIFALAAVGVAADQIESAADWLETQAATYTGPGDDVTTGAIGKLLLVAATTGRDPRAFGGVDLVAEIEAVEVEAADPDDAAALPGRFRDLSDFGDFSTPLTHSLVLLGLHRTSGVAPSPQSVEVLLDQQCADGGFSEAFLTDGAACVSAVDTTAYAVQALAGLGEDAAVTAGATWLATQVSADGSFGSSDGQNTNSTGLAATALAVADGDPEVIALARDFIVATQDSCDDADPGAIPFNAVERGFAPLSTAQALPGLLGVGLADVDASSAAAAVPALDCPTPADPVDDGAGPAPEAALDADADAGEATRDDTEGADTPQPNRVDAGTGVSDTVGAAVPGRVLAGTGALLGAVLLLAGVSRLTAERRRGPA